MSNIDRKALRRMLSREFPDHPAETSFMSGITELFKKRDPLTEEEREALEISTNGQNKTGW